MLVESSAEWNVVSLSVTRVGDVVAAVALRFCAVPVLLVAPFSPACRCSVVGGYRALRGRGVRCLFVTAPFITHHSSVIIHHLHHLSIQFTMVSGGTQHCRHLVEFPADHPRPSLTAAIAAEGCRLQRHRSSLHTASHSVRRRVHAASTHTPLSTSSTSARVSHSLACCKPKRDNADYRNGVAKSGQRPQHVERSGRR